MIGIDVGTNSLVAAKLDDDGNIVYKQDRDAFYRIVPKSRVNRDAIKMSLDNRNINYIEEGSNFNVVGSEAIQMALDRNDKSSRPMTDGVISSADKSNLPILKILLESLVGKGSGEKLVYSIPGKPIDSDLDVIYHETILDMFFTELGYKPQAINEAYAGALDSLIETGVNGIYISLGAGCQNIVIAAQGDPVITFSTIRSGDYIDKQVGQALDISPSLVQLEKEAGVDLINPSNKIMEAVSIYYKAVVKYTVDNIVYELKKNKGNIPVFREPVPVVIGGGLSFAKGCQELYEQELRKADLPFDLGEIRVVDEPDKCVASGCLLAAQL